MYVHVFTCTNLFDNGITLVTEFIYISLILISGDKVTSLKNVNSFKKAF